LAERAWTKPASDHEDERRKRTETEIRAAIDAHPLLSSLGISVYAKGSYANNTNVRRDSDVDIAVQYTDIAYFEYGPDTTQDEVWAARGISPYSGPFRTAAGATNITAFKDAIGDALVGRFGSAAVTRGNKVFTVRESSRSLAADVIPCATYYKHWSTTRRTGGIRLLPDRWPGHHINNFPQQHYDEGVAKNNATGRRYKSVVRILKNLENHMVKQGHGELPGFLVESLVFNVPNSKFDASTWEQRIRNVLFYIWDNTEDVSCETEWLEANGIKYLFHTNQKWTRDETRAWILAAWRYVKVD
jgi:hypothetical protein